MKILVVYYSHTGHTRKVATALAGRLGAEIAEIQPAGSANIVIGAMKAFLSLGSPIRKCWTDLDTIGFLVIATPVWAGRIPPYVITYLRQVQDGIHKPFCVLIERGAPGSVQPLMIVRKMLEDRGMRFAGSLETLEKEVKNGSYEEKIRLFSAEIAKVK